VVAICCLMAAYRLMFSRRKSQCCREQEGELAEHERWRRWRHIHAERLPPLSVP
jgi:hypothetical protein